MLFRFKSLDNVTFIIKLSNVEQAVSYANKHNLCFAGFAEN